MPTISRAPRRVTPQDLKVFLEVFFQETDVSASGSVSYHGLDFGQMFDILPDAFDWHPDLTRRQAHGVLRQALNECRKANECSEQALLMRAEALGKARLSKKPQHFTMWTKFRAREMSNNASFKLSWNGVHLRSNAGLPKYLRLQEYHLNGHGQIHPDSPSFYGYMLASCKARDEDNAVHQMLDAMQLFYGLANIYARWGQYTLHFGNNWTDGPLWLGPYQFTFRSAKFLGKDRLWYNPDFVGEAWSRNPLGMGKVLTLLPRIRKALAALEKHPLREVLVRSILLLQDGFATRDGSHRLLRYWSALEQLYGDDPNNRNQQRIIQRASFAEPAPALERWKLSHAAHLRNGHVHAGDPRGEVDTSAEYLRNLLSRHINHLIHVRSDLKNHAQWLELVDLPAGKNKLNAKKDLIDIKLGYFA